MLARARIQFGMSAEEFWEMSQDEWIAYCWVMNRSMMFLDRQLGEMRHMMASMFRAPGSRVPPVTDYYLVKDPDVPEEDFFSLLEAMS